MPLNPNIKVSLFSLEECIKLLQREDIYSPFVCTSTMFSSDFPDCIMLLSTIKKWEIRRDLPEGGMMEPATWRHDGTYEIQRHNGTYQREAWWNLPEGGMMGPGRGSCQQNDEKSLQTQLLEKQEPLGWAMCFSQGFTETPPITKSHSNTGWQWTDASWHKKCLIFFSSMKTRLVYKAIK